MTNRSIYRTTKTVQPPRLPIRRLETPSEQYADVYNKIYGLPTVSLGYFTVFGPLMRPNMAFTSSFCGVSTGSHRFIYGDGSQTRDFTYKVDVVRVNFDQLEETGF